MDDARRISLLKSTVAIFFIVSIFFAGQLWSGVRSYPFAPLFSFLSLIPAWGDFLLLSLLLASLFATLLLKKPKIYLIGSIVITYLLFAQDQNRLFPSFFEYWSLLFVLAFYWLESEGRRRADWILNACRLAVAFVYFWSGVQKVTPLFQGQLTAVLAPVTNVLPFLNGGFVHWAAIVAPLIEIEIGIGLLFKRTRNFALAEAVFMHVALFFLISPFRDPSYGSAWTWNLASACIVLILFFKAKDVGTKEIVWNFKDLKTGIAQVFVLLAFGVLPALSLVNLWDSSLSFNVFSGNVAYADIYIDGSTTQSLPPAIQQYVGPTAEENGMFPLDINVWAQQEFHSQPVPTPRIFKAITKSLCQYAARPSSIELTIYEKQTIFEYGSGSQNATSYDCAGL